MNFSLSDELLYTTIKLRQFSSGQETGSGTGFFWKISIKDSREIVLIITNRHVVDDCDYLEAACHEASSDGALPAGTAVNCRLMTDLIVHHPNPDIDLCAIMFGSIINQANDAGRPIFFKSADNSHIPSSLDWEKFDSIEDVTMIGCPRGIYDAYNNIPIVRKGITATPLAKDYEGRPEFLVDMACFPGSSGSPIYMMSRGHFDRESRRFLLDSWRFHLLGILYSGPTVTNEGAIYFSRKPTIAVSTMMHLGQAIKSNAIFKLEDSVCEQLGVEKSIVVS